MLWTVSLVGTSLLGVWFAPRHWWGWAITTASEVLWAAYALSLHSTSLLIMSFVWFVLNGRGAIVSYRDQHRAQQLRFTPSSDGFVGMEIARPGNYVVTQRREPTVHEMQMMSPKTWDKLHARERH